MEFVVDWNSVCLVCLQKGKMRSLHEKDSIGTILSEKIMKCCNIAISGRNFPEQICIVCEMDLEAAYRFKTNAETSNAILKSLLEARNKTKTLTKTATADCEQLICNGSSSTNLKLYGNANEIKIEEMENKVRIETSIECDVIRSKLMSEDFQSVDNFESVAVNNYEQLILPRKLLITGVKKQENNTSINHINYQRKSRTHYLDEFADKKIIGDIVEVVTKSKTCNKPLKICEICGNSYKYQNALENHMRRHRNEKPFSCEFCQRSFVANVELRRHMRVHTGQKPYTCHFCPRAFSDFGSRGKHERTHTGERPYECETCGKTFAYAHVLQVHILTHTGEKKYKCSTCGKGFTKKSYLISHTNNTHRSNN